MNEPKAPNVRRLAIIGGLFLLLTIALLFWAREVVRELIVLPISYLIWVIGIIIDSTPQIFFWLSLLVISFLIASRSLSRRRKILASYPSGYAVPDDPASTGRVVYWLAKVQLLRARQGGFYSRSFHSALGRMVLELLSYRYRLGPRQVEDAVREGTLNIPQDIRAYLLESMQPPEPSRRGFFVDLWISIVRAIQDRVDQIQASRRQRSVRKALPAMEENEPRSDSRLEMRVEREDPRVKRVITYINEELEVSHGKSGS